jgi:hypothetical protein
LRSPGVFYSGDDRNARYLKGDHSARRFTHPDRDERVAWTNAPATHRIKGSTVFDIRSEVKAVRAFFSLLLIALLALCPILCGAREFGHGAHRHGSSSGTSPDPAPGQCPEDGDNCICQGAVQVDHVRIDGSDFLTSPLLLASFAHTPLHPVAHLTWDGSPTGLASWGDAGTVRSLLQNFRC